MSHRNEIGDNLKQALINTAQAVWAEEGDCELTDWECMKLRFSIAVIAYGKPPRKRTLYRHVFLFHQLADTWCLRSISRARGSEYMSWMVNGQPVNPRHQYRWFHEGEKMIAPLA